jgi:branched-chain amino acid transport system ATP-binding protein
MPISATDPLSAADPLLEVAGLSTGYGKIGVLHGIDLTVGAGEVVALLGPNGAGKTTLLRAVSGLLPRSGRVRFAGRDLAGNNPREIVKAGLAHVIEGHRVFTQLAVFDNLLLAAYDLPRGERSARVEEVLTLFPEIAAKRHERAGALSGGQQQILAVAQGLVRRPRLLMLDEPSAGLSRCGAGAARSRDCRAAGRAVDREGARACRSRLCPRPWVDRAGGQN